jgi:hypothetical protein
MDLYITHLKVNFKKLTSIGTLNYYKMEIE